MEGIIKSRDDELWEKEKYNKDLEGIIKRQHEDMRILREEIEYGKSELKEKNIKIYDLRENVMRKSY